VGCEGFREALSARLDAEEVPPEQAAALDAHLTGCPDCRDWQDTAAVVTRRFRTGPAVAGVDVTGAVLPTAPGPGRARLAVALRLLLGGLGLAQLVLGLAQVTMLRAADGGSLHGTTVDGATPGHLWHESAAWNIAIGAGFLWVATRRARPVGIVPILTVFIGVLLLLSASDLAAGRVEPARLASHAFVLTGYLAVVALSRSQFDLTPPGQAGRASRRWRLPGRALVPDRVIRFPRPGQPTARTRRQEAA
jgi:predicted anti-sigma-YlaC factor YlaD